MDVGKNAATEAVLEEGFSTFLTKRSSLTKRVLLAALPYCHMESGGSEGEKAETLIVDEGALLLGLIADGLRERQQKTSSLWFVEWLADHGLKPEGLLAEGIRDVRLPLSPRANVLPSEVLREWVLPVAQRIGEATTGSRDFHLRHLAYALFIGLAEDRLAPLTGELLHELRKDFLDRVVETYPRERKRWMNLSDLPMPEKPESSSGAEPAGATTAQATESVGVYADAATITDRLGRQVFAEILAGRICEAADSARHGSDGSDAAFIVHMEGPWGSGKSTLLKLLKRQLEGKNPSWLVVEFNAWRNQHRKPSWLPVILEVRTAAVQRLSIWSPLVWLAWLAWRIRMDWLPYLIGLALIAFAAFLVWGAGNEAAAGWAGQLLGVPKSTGEAVKSVVTVLAAVGSLIAMARGLALGSQRNAEAYLAFKSEPFRRIIRFFEWLVRATRRPVAVFVDDLDRCDIESVIELLEGIQTSLRGAPIVYIVAGDRRWITCSYKKKYEAFGDEISSLGRPLSHQFLNKVFQLSVSVPRMSKHHKQRFLGYLLGEDIEAAQKSLQAKAVDALSDKTSHEELQRAISDTTAGTVEREIFQAAAAKQITSPKATTRTEHRLRDYADLIESNPRAMKLLVNMLAVSQAAVFLEGRQVPFDTLVRWTILETRWPLLADYVVRNWPEVDLVNSPKPDMPTDIAALLRSSAVRSVVGINEDSQLTKDRLDLLLQ